MTWPAQVRPAPNPSSRAGSPLRTRPSAMSRDSASGIEAADAARSQDLCELTLRFALNHLRPGGDLLVKTFHASGYGQYVQQLKKRFKTVSVRKPAASRPGSAEVYLLARGLKPDPDPVTESM